MAINWLIFHKIIAMSHYLSVIKCQVIHHESAKTYRQLPWKSPTLLQWITMNNCGVARFSQTHGLGRWATKLRRISSNPYLLSSVPPTLSTESSAVLSTMFMVSRPNISSDWSYKFLKMLDMGSVPFKKHEKGILELFSSTKGTLSNWRNPSNDIPIPTAASAHPLS